MSTGERWRLGRRPALDGLRGIAILLVLAAHAHIPGMETAGPVGVTVFFTLSGFLITSLLVEDHAAHGQVRLGRFYRRRVRRLFPALFCCILVVAVLGLFVSRFVQPMGVISASLHLSNWALAWWHTHYFGALSHTWSLAVEEQFYAVWPLLFSLVAHRRGLALAVACGGVLASTVERFALWDGGAGQWRVYYGADTHADALLAGCALALVFARWGAPRSRPGVVLAGVGVLAGLGFATGTVAGLWVPSLVVALTIVVLVFSVGGCELLEVPWLRLVGERSYGLYLWHYPVSVLVSTRLGEGNWVAQLLVMLPAAAVLTWLSWRYVEQPFLRRRERVLVDAARPEPALA